MNLARSKRTLRNHPKYFPRISKAVRRMAFSGDDSDAYDAEDNSSEVYRAPKDAKKMRLIDQQVKANPDKCGIIMLNGNYFRPMKAGKYVPIDVMRYLQWHQERIEQVMNRLIIERQGIKAQLVITIEYEKLKPTHVGLDSGSNVATTSAEADDVEDVKSCGFSTKMSQILHTTMVSRIVSNMLEVLKRRHDDMEGIGSGNVIRAIEKFELYYATYTPLAPSSYLELPPFLAKKECIVNVKNLDHRCFGYALLSALHPVDRDHHPNRPSKYDGFFEEHGLDALDYPVAVEELEDVERQINIAFNVFEFFDDRGLAR